MNTSDQEPLPPKQIITAPSDINAVCHRNAISDVTFHDSLNIINRLVSRNPDGFPYTFIKENKAFIAESHQMLEKNLKDGRQLPAAPFKDDWIILVMVAVVFTYGLIRLVSRKLFPELTRFFLFRNIGDPVSRDTGGLFHWESTLINLISFINIALFAYYTLVYYNVFPSDYSGISLWLILLGIVIAAVTIRHIICSLTGNFSGEKEAFDEYLLAVYQSYRYLALFLLILVILISYTFIFRIKSLLLTGIILFAAVYLIRIIRLFLIFMKRDISILYLILYLCALEFLPVVVSIKYFTGLF